MNTKHKPATALPFEFCNDRDGFWIEHQGVQIATISHESDNAGLAYGDGEKNGRYLVHTANAYPELVEALKELVARCDGIEGVRADGSNIQTHNAHGILSKLGEA